MRPQGLPSVGQIDRDHYPSARLELMIRGGGIRPGAAGTITLSNGACSGQPYSRSRPSLSSWIALSFQPRYRRCASSCWPAQREMRPGPKTGAGRGEFSKPKGSMRATMPSLRVQMRTIEAEIPVLRHQLNVLRRKSPGRLAFSINHQKPGRGIAERLRDLSCRRSSDQASGCLAARLQGGAIRGRVCAFLAARTEHPNTQAWGRRKDVKVFGCSDDCARCGTAKVDRMPTNE